LPTTRPIARNCATLAIIQIPLSAAETGDPSEPKTKTSIRSIPLNSELRSVLVDLNRPHRGPWIFSDSKGNLLDTLYFRISGTDAKGGAGRYTQSAPNKTFLRKRVVVARENVIEVSRMLGHASVAMTVDVFAK
jgi:hypothetical protein